jgi:hypothetical protein
MRKILTGYAVSFNRRHRRSGHLFQNRYKSILVEEDLYLLELVRYIHLNPLRVNVVKTMAELARYPWSGHAVLLGHTHYPWQDADYVLQHFGTVVGEARYAYETFVAGGIEQGKRPDLAGGGLLRSAGVKALQRGREAWASDERILGSSPFVISVTEELKKAQPAQKNIDNIWEPLIRRTAQMLSLMPAEITSGSRRMDVVRARFVMSYIATKLGLGLADVAGRLSISKQSVLRGIEKGPELLRQMGFSLEAFIGEIN